MNISDLINKLQLIDKTVPFDSEVVSGDDWMPDKISAVYHEPPYTFIQFSETHPHLTDPDFTYDFNEQELLLIKSFITYLFEQYKSEDIELSEVVSLTAKLNEITRTRSPESVIAFVRSHI